MTPARLVCLLLSCLWLSAARAQPPGPSAAAAAPARGPSGILQEVQARRVLRVGMTPGVVPFVAAGAEAEELQRLVAGAVPAAAAPGAAPAAPAAAPLSVARATDGRPVCGFDVELAAEAARALGARLEIVLVDRTERLLPGLRAGDYDLVISALTRTLDRALSVAFSEPYFASGLQVMVRDPARYQTLEALRQHGVRVAARTGTTAETFVRERLRGATLLPAPTEAALFAAMAPDGAADAVAVDYVTARDAAVRGRLRQPLHAVEDRRFTTERFAFAVRQGDPDWLLWLNLFLTEHRASGAFHRLAARFNPWFRSER